MDADTGISSLSATHIRFEFKGKELTTITLCGVDWNKDRFMDALEKGIHDFGPDEEDLLELEGCVCLGKRQLLTVRISRKVDDAPQIFEVMCTIAKKKRILALVEDLAEACG